MPVKFPSPEFDAIFDEAARCFEKGDKGQHVLRNGNISRVENLLPLIAAALNLNLPKLRLSSSRVQNAVRHELASRLDHKEPAKDFNDKFKAFEKMLSDLPLESYLIGIPLPLLTTLKTNPTWTLDDTVFQPMAWSDWDKLVADAGSNLKDLLERNKHALDPKQFTPYAVAVSARDPVFAIQHAVDSLEAVLGMVNYAAFYKRGYPTRFGGTGSQRWSDLRHPFIFLARRPDGKVMVWREDDEGHRRPFRLDNTLIDRYNAVFPHIPSLKRSDRFDQVILAAFQHYQRAMTAASFPDIFGHFWRGIEAAALTQPREPSGKNMDNMAGLIGYADKQPVLNFRLERMSLLRNALVHTGSPEPIDDSDLNFMSGTLRAAIDAYIGTRGKYSLEDLRFIMAQSPDADLLTRRAELLADIIKWRKQAEEDAESMDAPPTPKPGETTTVAAAAEEAKPAESAKAANPKPAA